MSAALAVREAPCAAPSSEFSFGVADFERVRALIHRRAGINLSEGKQAMVYSRLSRRLRELGHDSFTGYLQALERADDHSAEWQEFVNCLTTNLTSFYREEHHFGLLGDELRRHAARPQRIWCNAASTGEEPYTLAMTVSEALGAQPRVQIVCSDIDTNVLAKAKRAVYPADSRGLDAQRLQRHFLRGTGPNAGSIRVKPELAQLVEFRVLNLMAPRWDLGETFDYIFCRNVMIYFDAATQRRVLEGMHAVLRPHGLLFAGHSENFAGSKDLFHLRGKTVYERV
jgi:chemotaxis protein methyltransferase CheR